jgi:hypothetical protein
MANALKHLATACEGNGRPECPIIDGLGGAEDIEHCAPRLPARKGLGRKPHRRPALQA